MRLILWLASCISVLSFLFYYKQGDVLLYGDAVAHLNIARRVFDSKTPGLLQLGTVWLPLPHLLMIPFLVSDELWRSGAGGSMPSLIAYVLGVIGIFRLIRGSLASGPETDLKAQFAAWVAALVYALNPNLVYMQSTAMGEAVYLALFIWAVVYFAEAVRGDSKAINKCGLCLAGACLTRYDGWFLAAVMCATVVAARINAARHASSGQWCPPAGRFVAIAAAAPILWLAYNGIVYKNPLEFENGPYSAKAIEHRTQVAGNPGHPGSGNLPLAALYFNKAVEENLSRNAWLQRGLLTLGALGFVGLFLFQRQRVASGKSAVGWPLLFLLTPIPFYALSIAYGGVPIFVPPFWPFTHYNVRYGLQLLPAFAAGVGMLIYFTVTWERWSDRWRGIGVLIVIAVVGAGYISGWGGTPICLEEAQVNMRTRNQLEKQVAGWLEKLPPHATILMYVGDHVGALEQAGIPLRNVIDEGNHRVWKQPTDPDGLWERALANPQQYADYVMAFEGDPVWQAVQPKGLKELVEIHVTGQPRGILYASR